MEVFVKNECLVSEDDVGDFADEEVEVRSGGTGSIYGVGEFIFARLATIEAAL